MHEDLAGRLLGAQTNTRQSIRCLDRGLTDLLFECGEGMLFRRLYFGCAPVEGVVCTCEDGGGRVI